MSVGLNRIWKKIISLCIVLPICTAIFVMATSVPSCAATSNSLVHDSDTADYCLMVNNVTVNQSDFNEMTENELQASIIEASDFRFRIRSENGTLGQYQTKEHYSVDFSKLQSKPTITGYLVKVTVDKIRLETDSSITFKVFVADDMSNISYSFISGTDGQTLPSIIMEMLPSSSLVKQGEIIAPTTNFENVRSNGGTWSFTGWNINNVIIGNHDVNFEGTWQFEKDKPQDVAYNGTAQVQLQGTHAQYVGDVREITNIGSNSNDEPANLSRNYQLNNSTNRERETRNFNIYVALATLASGGVLTVLILSLVSDFKVLRWYNHRKQANWRS